MSDAGSENLPARYAHAERSSTPCRIIGCDEMRVRSISVCATHEHQFDTGDWPPGMDGWRAFLAAAGGDGNAAKPSALQTAIAGMRDSAPKSTPVERAALAALVAERDRYRAGLERIAHAESGVWGQIAYRALRGDAEPTSTPDLYASRAKWIRAFNRIEKAVTNHIDQCIDADELAHVHKVVLREIGPKA